MSSSCNFDKDNNNNNNNNSDDDNNNNNHKLNSATKLSLKHIQGVNVLFIQPEHVFFEISFQLKVLPVK